MRSNSQVRLGEDKILLGKISSKKDSVFQNGTNKFKTVLGYIYPGHICLSIHQRTQVGKFQG